MSRQYGFAPTILIVVLAFLSVGAAYIYGLKQGKQFSPLPSLSSENVACTQDAMQCPDGSYVGRTGPNCEFVCPSSDTSNWKTYKDDVLGYSLKYPNDILIRRICPEEELTLSRRSSNETEDIARMPTCARDSRYDLEVTFSEKPIIPTTDESYTVSKIEVNVGGVLSSKYVSVLKDGVLGPYAKRFTTVHIPKRGIVYQLHWGWNEKDTVFDEILKTFEFTY